MEVRLRARAGHFRLVVDFSAESHTLAVIGPNGSGKSTLLGCLLGVRPVEHGFIQVGSVVLCDTTQRRHVPVEQRKLAYVPQAYALFPHLTVRQNLAFALDCATSGLSSRERASRIDGMLTELELEHLDSRKPQLLSGGEKQRVAIARALITNPRALLLDEPLAALDIQSRHQVRSFLERYLSRLAIPTILVTHDVSEARRLTQRVLVLENGRAIQFGTWETLESTPANDFVRSFVSPKAAETSRTDAQLQSD
jgi:molybdate transport system ATP-binding protein